MNGRRVKQLRKIFLRNGGVSLKHFRRIRRLRGVNVAERVAFLIAIRKRTEATEANNERNPVSAAWTAKATYGKQKRTGSFAHHLPNLRKPHTSEVA